MSKRIKKLKIRVSGISQSEAQALAEEVSQTFTGARLQKIKESGQTHVRIQISSHDRMSNENIVRAIRDGI